MGGLLSTKSEDTIEVLERITKEYDKIEAAQRKHARVERQIQSGFFFYGALLFLIALAFGIAFFYIQPTALRGALSVLFVSLAPVFVYIIYRCVRSLRAQRFEKRTARMRELMEQKQEILDEVAEKETYKKAKEIMEKYGRSRAPERLYEPPGSVAHTFNALARSGSAQRSSSASRINAAYASSTSTSPSTSSLVSSSGTKSIVAMRSDAASYVARVERASESLRRRVTTPQPASAPQQLQRASRTTGSQTSLNVADTEQPAQASTAQHLGESSVRNALSAARSIFIDARSAIRPLFSPDRSVVERLTDLMLGDGPDARFALVCRFCYAHNGMALPDEFCHITFRCAYCTQLNPARSLNPERPRDSPSRQSDTAAASRERFSVTPERATPPPPPVTQTNTHSEPLTDCDTTSTHVSETQADQLAEGSETTDISERVQVQADGDSDLSASLIDSPSDA